MRILHVVDSLEPTRGGVAAAVQHLCEQLYSAGASVEVVSAGPPVAIAGRGEISHYAVPASGPFGLSLRLGRWLQDNIRRFDVVELHGVFHYPSIRAGMVARRAGVPYVVHPHGSLDLFDIDRHRRGLKWAVGTVILRPLLNQAYCVLVTTPREGERLHTFGAKPTVMSVGLPVEMSAPASPQSTFRHRYGIPDSAFLLLFLGRLERKKGIERLLEAAASSSGVHVVIAGTGDMTYVSALRERAETLAASVTWVGFISGTDKAAAFSAADAFVLHSDNENFAVTVIEAARSGLPLILSEDVFIASVFSTAGGALIASRDPGALVSCIAELASSPGLARAMGQHAKEVALRHFNPHKLTVAHLDVLRTAVGSASPKSGAVDHR